MILGIMAYSEFTDTINAYERIIDNLEQSPIVDI